MIKTTSILTAITIIILPINTAMAKKHVPKLTAKNAILSIIGEAENQQKYSMGMLAIACAIRNRGTLSGVYGLNAPRVKEHKYSQKTYNNAKLAWDKSAIPSACAFINGADGWENVTAFGVPYWVKYSTHTITIGDHRFYKQNTKRKRG